MNPPCNSVRLTISQSTTKKHRVAQRNKKGYFIAHDDIKKMNLFFNYTKTHKPLIISSFSIIIGIAFSIQNLAFYLRFDFNLLLSLMLVPFVLYIKHKENYSLRFGIISLFFLVSYPFLKVQSFYFFGFTFFLLFVIENNIGRFNNLPVFLLVLLSPVAIFAIEVFSFPIRLWLTDVSTQIISFVNKDINSSGNQIFMNGDKYTVDPECMGLKMVITGYLLCLVIIAWFEKKSKKQISLFQVIIILFITSLLIIISNLFRIIGIIFTRTAPDTILHEMLGIFSLVIYVILPLYLIVKLVYRYFSKPIKQKTKQVYKANGNILILILLGLLAILNYNRENYRTVPADIDIAEIKIEGFQCNLLENKVVQLTNDSALVYIKAIPNFYSADHTPLICWKGSGYQLNNQQKTDLDNYKVYTAELAQPNSDTLYTAWWYDNGKHQTISQLDWRWRLIKGEDGFSLVNVTCKDRKKLEQEIKDLKTVCKR